MGRKVSRKRTRRPKNRVRPVFLFALILIIAISIFIAAHRSGPKLPVLMYHHFSASSSAGTVVSTDRFREQMGALRAEGYTTVTLQQVLDYVDDGTPLPDKPVLITMDDGYTSDLTVAAPILEQMGFCATIFVIGINEGESTYVHSGAPLTPPRFSYEEAAEWVEKGVLDLQSHTFDMHQLASYGFSGRDGILPMEGETEGEYEAALRRDAKLFRDRREDRVSTPLVALAYPFGYCDKKADQILAEEGIRITFTIDEHTNRLRTGKPECLRMLGRFNITDGCTGEELIELLKEKG